MKKALLTIFFITTLFSAHAEEPLHYTINTPSEALKAIDNVGVNQVLNAHGSDLLNAIANWGPEWLTVAEKISCHLDGAFSEDMPATLANALLRSPEDVLAAMQAKKFCDSGYNWPNTICHVPIYMGAELSKKNFEAQKAAMNASVGTVSDPNLRVIKMQCLTSIKNDKFENWNK